MIGMPTRAMVLDTGTGADVICENRSAAIPSVLPQRTEAGMMCLCADVLQKVLAR